MHAGEPDAEAVRRLQGALLDLGYDVVGGEDGQFGGGTGDAVVAFKTEEGLFPNDPVASTGTIGRLDAYFAHEAADPDSPDPSRDGLSELVETAMRTGVEQITAAIDALNRVPSGEEHFDDPVWIDFNQKLERNFHVHQSELGRERAIDEVILPAFHGAKRALDLPFFTIQSETREGYRATFPNEDYRDLVEHLGGQIFVMPPFRNALTDEQRVAVLIRLGVGLDGRIRLFAVPGSPRYLNLGGDGVANKMAYAAFAFEIVHAAAFVPFHARYRWYD